jgi:hypothetical protein
LSADADTALTTDNRFGGHLAPDVLYRLFLVILVVAAVTNGAATAASSTGAASKTIWNVETTVNPNGTTWTAAPSPTPGGKFQIANAITVISPDDAWAVGSDVTGNDVTLAAHWNGKKWSLVPTPNLTGVGRAPQDQLTGVSALGADNVWASGYTSNVNGGNLADPFVLHWDGSTWALTNAPNLGTEGSSLRATQALSPTDVWAVGQEQIDNGSIFTLTEHFNGSGWSAVKSPDPGMQGKLFNNSLDSISSAGGGSLFAVGAREMTGQCWLRTLAISTNEG